MPVTINVNMLSLVHQISVGIATASAPDVCKTPTPVGTPPIPYPNVAQSATLVSGTKRVLVDGGVPAAIQGSEFPVSVGDQPGVAGGVASGVNMNKAAWVLFSFNVMLEGKNACRLSDMMTMNKENTICAGIIQQPVP